MELLSYKWIIPEIGILEINKQHFSKNIITISKNVQMLFVMVKWGSEIIVIALHN